jgi:hypothetical protein
LVSLAVPVVLDVRGVLDDTPPDPVLPPVCEVWTLSEVGVVLLWDVDADAVGVAVLCVDSEPSVLVSVPVLVVLDVRGVLDDTPPDPVLPPVGEVWTLLEVAVVLFWDVDVDAVDVAVLCVDSEPLASVLLSFPVAPEDDEVVVEDDPLLWLLVEDSPVPPAPY